MHQLLQVIREIRFIVLLLSYNCVFSLCPSCCLSNIHEQPPSNARAFVTCVRSWQFITIAQTSGTAAICPRIAHNGLKRTLIGKFSSGRQKHLLDRTSFAGNVRSWSKTNTYFHAGKYKFFTLYCCLNLYDLSKHCSWNDNEPTLSFPYFDFSICLLPH